MLRALVVATVLFTTMLVGASTAQAVPGDRAFALSGTNLVAFQPTNPSVTMTTAITGINAGETLVGIDVRPQNGVLYGLGINATANTGTLYAIATDTGFAGAVGSPGGVSFTTDGVTPIDFPDPAVVGWGFDVSPSADRIRVTAGNGLNFRVNPNTGAGVDGDNTGSTSGVVSGTNPDGTINGGTTTIDASAYTNNRANNGNVTTLYGLDSASDTLFIQTPPNAGTQGSAKTVMLAGSPRCARCAVPASRTSCATQPPTPPRTRVRSGSRSSS